MLPRIGLLIPAFNSEATIGATLDSVLEQDSGLSCLATVCLADDGSHDDTVRRARERWHGPIALRILDDKQNVGERANVNRAIGRLRNQLDWLLVLHADDVAKREWLLAMTERIARSTDRIGSVCSSWDNWWPDGSVAPGENDPSKFPELILGTQATVRGTILRGCWWHISGCAIRLATFDEVGGFEPHLQQMGDWDWLLRCLSRGWSIEYIPRALIKYRIHASSVSTASFRTDRDIRESLEIALLHRGSLSRREWLGWHIRRLSFCARRLTRAAINRDSARLGHVLLTSILISKSMLRNLVR